MIQVIYVQYMTVKVKSFSGETEKEDALSFIDALRNHLFLPGGVLLGMVTSEWAKSQVGDRAERNIFGRIWWDPDHPVDTRIEEVLKRDLAEPCQHCDTWCGGRCRGATSCLQSGKPGHTHCSSRLIDEGVLTRRY